MAIQTWWQDLPDPILTETAWERQMNLVGIESYTAKRDPDRLDANGNKVAQTAASDTGPGQKFIRQMVKDATEAVTSLQVDTIGITRVERNLKATVLVVPADTSALLVLKPMMDRAYCSMDAQVGASYQTVITEVAKSVELELNFRHWVKSSREAASAYAKAQGMAKVPLSTAERLVEEQGLSKRNLIRWKHTFADLGKYNWSTEERHYCGDALVHAVALKLPEFFEIHLVFKAGKQQKFLRVTESFRNAFEDLDRKIANMQMVKLPMITMPKKWHLTDE
jgi:hypothetical protein